MADEFNDFGEGENDAFAAEDLDRMEPEEDIDGGMRDDVWVYSVAQTSISKMRISFISFFFMLLKWFQLDQPQEGQERVEILEDGEPQATEKSKRVTTRYMTKYERARVLGTRALQISMNAPVMVDIAGETDPLKIAMKELRERKIPMIIRRYMPDNSFEDWSIDELIIE